MGSFASRVCTAAALAALTACTPALDWRELTPEGADVVAMFPCSPNHHERALRLAAHAGSQLSMQMLVCSADDATYAIGYVDVADPAQVGPVLAELREAALRNIDAAQPVFAAASVPGMTPHPEAVRAAFSGRLPDGRTMRERALYFAKGMRAYQASVIGAQPSDEAVETFFAGLRLP
ncbi:MAG: hypothetical protein JSR59_23860 [Proteobacteria bacterium]|nr:hypothetical protein [Pseudomonadota bacterium]